MKTKLLESVIVGILAEGKFEFLQTKYPTVPLEEFKSLPPKYWEWIAKQAIFSGNPDSQRFIDTVKHNIQEFDRFSKSGRIQEKDINSFKNLDDLVNTVSKSFETEKTTINRDVQPVENSDILYYDDVWMIVHPRSKEASCYYGMGTKWCVSATESENWFNTYTKEGSKFYFFINRKEANKRKEASKIALQYSESEEAWIVFDTTNTERPLAWFRRVIPTHVIASFEWKVGRLGTDSLFGLLEEEEEGEPRVSIQPNLITTKGYQLLWTATSNAYIGVADSFHEFLQFLQFFYWLPHQAKLVSHFPNIESELPTGNPGSEIYDDYFDWNSQNNSKVSFDAKNIQWLLHAIKKTYPRYFESENTNKEALELFHQFIQNHPWKEALRPQIQAAFNVAVQNTQDTICATIKCPKMQMHIDEYTLCSLIGQQNDDSKLPIPIEELCNGGQYLDMMSSNGYILENEEDEIRIYKSASKHNSLLDYFFNKEFRKLGEAIIVPELKLSVTAKNPQQLAFNFVESIRKFKNLLI